MFHQKSENKRSDQDPDRLKTNHKCDSSLFKEFFVLKKTWFRFIFFPFLVQKEINISSHLIIVIKCKRLKAISRKITADDW